MFEKFYIKIMSVWNVYIKIISIWKCLYYFNISNKCIHTLIEFKIFHFEQRFQNPYHYLDCVSIATVVETNADGKSVVETDADGKSWYL